MGNAVIKKPNRNPPIKLKSVEIFAESQKSIGSLHSNETFGKAQYILDQCHFVAIYDGHGHYGGSAAYDANETLMRYFDESKNLLNELSSEKQIKNFILEGFKKVQARLTEETIYRRSGTCCVAALIYENKLYVINIGNSKAVLCTKIPGGLKATSLTKQHNLDYTEERERIIQKGLKVRKVVDNGKEFGIERIWADDHGPGHTVTRALGAWELSQSILSEPEVEEYELNANDRFVVLGSDGLWDVISPDEAIKILNDNGGTKEAVKELVKQAKNKWKQRVLTQKYVVGDDHKDLGKTDDITAVVAHFVFPMPEEIDVLERFSFAYKNKQARLKDLKNSLNK